MDAIHFGEVADGFLERLKRLIMVQVAHMLADEGLSASHERNGIFQICAGGEDGAARGQNGGGAGGITARAPQNDGAEGAGASHRIVDPARDGTLADQERVGKAGEPLARFIVAVSDRLTRSIGAGDDENLGRAAVEQQMMQWGVGKHDSKLVTLGGNVRERRERGSKDDGARGRCEKRLGFGSERHERCRDLEIRRHNGEGFLLAKLALAQRGHCRGIAGIASKVISANPLDREDAAAAQQIGGARNRAGSGVAVEQVARTAGRTGDRLRVKAAVGGIAILRVAQRIHGPTAHGGAAAIVGQSFDNGIARAAVGAVDIGIAVARIGGIAHFGETVRADREVGRDAGQRDAGVSCCFADGEIAKTGRLAKAHVDRSDAGGGRGLGAQIADKGLDGRLRAFEPDVDSVLLVQHPTCEGVRAGQTKHEGAKTDALDDSADLNGARGHAASVSRRSRIT